MALDRVRRRVARVLAGGSEADALERVAADLRELQQKVQVLQDSLHGLAAGHDELRARQLEELDAIRSGLTRVTDDLAARVAHLHERLGGEHG
jgi:outer membrane murein-binding lipoprotein Lpp